MSCVCCAMSLVVRNDRGMLRNILGVLHNVLTSQHGVCSWPSKLCGDLGPFLSIQVMASRLPRDLHGARSCHPPEGIRPSYLHKKHSNLSYLGPPSFVGKVHTFASFVKCVTGTSIPISRHIRPVKLTWPGVTFLACNSGHVRRLTWPQGLTWLVTECTWNIGSMGCIGGADRTFACKSQECLWHDWYI